MNLINLEPDASIEPGHQCIILPYTDEGRALGRLLIGQDPVWSYYDGHVIRIPHDQGVDQAIITLINELADIRYGAPALVQLTLIADSSQFVRDEAEELE